jgi:hypothetical protein
MNTKEAQTPELPPRPDRYSVEYRDCVDPSCEGTHAWTREQRNGMKQFALKLLGELAQAERENEALKARINLLEYNLENDLSDDFLRLEAIGCSRTKDNEGEAAPPLWNYRNDRAEKAEAELARLQSPSGEGQTFDEWYQANRGAIRKEYYEQDIWQESYLFAKAAWAAVPVADREKMLEVIREYRADHECELYEGHGGCSTCRKVDSLLSKGDGREK